MCVSPCVLVATVTTRTTRSCAHYIGALLASVPASVSSSARNSASFRLCATAPLRLFVSAPLRLCASILLSSLCAAILVLLCLSSLVLLCHSSRRRLLFCIRLCFCIRLFLCTCLCSAFARRPRLLHKYSPEWLVIKRWKVGRCYQL